MPGERFNPFAFKTTTGLISLYCDTLLVTQSLDAQSLSAQTLDAQTIKAGNTYFHYDEGTFTPLVRGWNGVSETIPGSLGYNTQIGKYAKCGKLVTIYVKLDFSYAIGGTDSILVSVPYGIEGEIAAPMGTNMSIDGFAGQGFLRTFTQVAHRVFLTNPPPSGAAQEFELLSASNQKIEFGFSYYTHDAS